MVDRRIGARGVSSGVARWLLIFAVAAGVAAMHVFGHPDHLGAMPQPTKAGSVLAAPAAMTPHHGTPHHGTTITGTERVGAADVPMANGMDPSAVCLAVLIAALLLPALRRAALSPRPARRRGGAVGEVPSGPAPPLAPSLQELSVLRL